MKRLVFPLSISIFVLFLLTSCSSENMKDIMTKPTELVVDKESIIHCVNEHNNLHTADDFYVDTEADMSNLEIISFTYPPKIPYTDFESRFKELYSFIFPLHSFGDEHFFFYNAATKEVDLIKENYSDLKEDKISPWIILYDEFGLGGSYSDDQVLLEISNPIGNDIFRFNRGKARKYAIEATADLDEDKRYYGNLEGLNITQYFDYVDTFSADSTRSFKLEDKELRICDAVTQYYDYIASLPFEHKDNMRQRVVSVEVYRMNDITYAYKLITTVSYNSIPIDYEDIGILTNLIDQDGKEAEDNFRIQNNAVIIRSGEIESVEGLPLSYNVTNHENVDKVITAEKAVDTISSYLTTGVDFEVNKLETVLFGSFNKDKNEYTMRPFWKTTLFNPNDNNIYFCYVNMTSEDEFYYYTKPQKGFDES